MTSQDKYNFLRMQYSTFDISDLIDSILRLCNIYDIDESCEKNPFEAIYRKTSNIMRPYGVQVVDIYNIYSSNIKFTLFPNAIGKISFYKSNKKDGTIEFSVQHALENYKKEHWDRKIPYYIINFINYIIDYRIEHDLKVITHEQIKQLLKKFLKNDLETIKTYFISLEETEIKKLLERSTIRMEIITSIEE